ncbi:hypothetical protein STFE110948_07145 [Streptobacillus felis]
MAYFAFYIQNSVDKIRNREIIEIIKILLTQFFYYCYIYYIQNLTNNNNVEVYGLFLIMKLLILVIVFLYFLTNENFSILFSNIIENKMINLLFVGIVVNRSLNFTPIFSIDVEKIWLYNTNPIISSVLTIYIISIFYFLDLSIFSNKIKIYFYLAIKVFSNIIINDSSVFLGIEIPKELILYTYLFTFIYGVFLIINSNKNGKVEIIYKYKLVILAIYIFNSILFVGVYKYDVYNFKNIFFDITSILIMLMYFQV